MKILTKDQFKDMPWKNGGGMTTELYKDLQTGDFNIRLSKAKVSQDGPFSHFPGIDRWLIILKGDGIILNDSIKLTKSHKPFFFKGEEDIYSRLIKSEVTDFNVMIRRNYGSVEILIQENGSILSENSETMIYEIENEKLILLSENENFEIKSKSIIVKIIKGP